MKTSADVARGILEKYHIEEERKEQENTPNCHCGGIRIKVSKTEGGIWECMKCGEFTEEKEMGK